MPSLFRSKNNSADDMDKPLAPAVHAEEPPLATAVLASTVEEVQPVPCPPPSQSKAYASPAAIAAVPEEAMPTKTPEKFAPVEAKASAGKTKKNTRPQRVVYSLGRSPVMMLCPYCGQNSSTRTKTYPNWITWVSAGGIAVLFWPVCWIPLVVDCMKKTDHMCLGCGEKVGSVEPFTDCCVKERA